MEQSWCGSLVTEGRRGCGEAELSEEMKKIERIVPSGLGVLTSELFCTVVLHKITAHPPRAHPV